MKRFYLCRYSPGETKENNDKSHSLQSVTNLVLSEYGLRHCRYTRQLGLSVRRSDIPLLLLSHPLAYPELPTDMTHHVVAVYWDQLQLLMLQSPRGQERLASVRVIRPVCEVRTAVCSERGPRDARHFARRFQETGEHAHVHSVTHRVPGNKGTPYNLATLPSTSTWLLSLKNLLVE
jgi:hypothetical protein